MSRALASLACVNFGPRNILYHQGLKYAVNQLLTTDPRSSLQDAKVCLSSGYWLDDAQEDS